MKQDIYQNITDQIIADIESGSAKGSDWIMPWHRDGKGGAGFPVSLSTGKPYRGVNVIALWCSASRQGFDSSLWGTFKQWKAQGASVRKGEKGTKVVFWKQLRIEDKDKGEDGERVIPLLKQFVVFNADQVNGFEGEVKPDSDIGADREGEADVIETAEAIIEKTGAVINYGGDRACYVPGIDQIFMPQREQFTATDTSTATERFYSTAFHELAHWTGADHRLARGKGNKFGSTDYAFEELVAELGAAFTCAIVGVSSAPRADHAQYIANWLEKLKSDKRFIFEAAKHATKAADMITGEQAEQERKAA